MKKELKRNTNTLTGWHDGLTGTPSLLLRGDVSRIWGDVSRIRGDVSRIRGDASGITGNVDGITGNVSGISGDVDAATRCGNAREDRASVSPSPACTVRAKRMAAERGRVRTDGTRLSLARVYAAKDHT